MYNILLEDGGFAKIENAVELGMLPKEATFPWVYSLRIRNFAVCRELIPEITFEKAKKMARNKNLRYLQIPKKRTAGRNL